MTAAIAAFRARKQPHIVQVFEVGTATMNFAPARISVDGSTVGLDGGVAFTLPEALFAPFGKQEVILGIRPEDLELADSGDAGYSLITSLVEHLGADTPVHGHFGDNQTDMTIRLSGMQNFQLGEALPMHIAAGKIHLFDAVTEKRPG